MVMLVSMRLVYYTEAQQPAIKDTDMDGALQPPSNQDGPFGYSPDLPSFLDPKQPLPGTLTPERAQQLSRDAFTTSTQWLNSSRREKWMESLRAFQNLHASGSKYLSRDWRYRSALYRPKTRSMTRRDEAETAAAFFSNEDVVSVTPTEQDNPAQLATAELVKKLLQYRLTTTVPWFLTVLGARQDCDVMGVAIGKTYWKYERYEKSRTPTFYNDPVTGELLRGEDDVEYQVTKDTPCVDLLAPENFRFDPASDWRDPIGTSPYLIEMIPMSASDVQLKMDTGEWYAYNITSMYSTEDVSDDATRRAREAGRVPGKDDDVMRVGAYMTCWIRFNIVNYGGVDYGFYSFGGNSQLLTDPVPLESMFPTGRKMYTCGYVNIETHKAYPASKVELFSDLQAAANEQWNLRFDNVKLVLNPRQIVKQGSGIDLNDVRTFMPGKSLLTDDPRNDIVWDRPPDVTASAYQEQQAIDADFNELAGDQTQNSMSAQMEQQSATGMHLLSGMAAGMAEYELRVFTETFIEPVLRQLIILEQLYETDQNILATCMQNAQLFQRFGINQVTDELLQGSVTTKVNVGIGATNSAFRLKRIGEAADAMGKMFGPTLAQGLNFGEVAKEIFGACGYDDGARFFKPGFDPQQAMQQMAQAKQAPQQNGPSQAELSVRAQTAQSADQTKLQIAAIRSQTVERTGMMNLARAAQQSRGETQRLAMQHDHDSRQSYNADRTRVASLFLQHAHNEREGHRDRAAQMMQQQQQGMTGE